MSDQPDSLVLRHLRRIDETLDRLIDDQTEVKQRAAALEQNGASLSRWLDRIDERVARIVKRLDLVDVT